VLCKKKLNLDATANNKNNRNIAKLSSEQKTEESGVTEAE